MRAEIRPAFYALNHGTWRDYLTLLHPPYTAWHLSYVVIGAAAAPVVRLDRLAWTLLAFFLAVGIAAHALDEIHGRPLKTRIPGTVLWAAAAAGILGAVGIGIWGTLRVMPSLWGFIAAGTFILLAYNLELFGGRFHSDTWFAASWGAFPVLTSYWASAGSFGPGIAGISAACFLLSIVQRKLSKQARSLRRSVRTVEGTIEYNDGARRPIGRSALLELPESVLRWLSAAIVVLAIGWLATRL